MHKVNKLVIAILEACFICSSYAGAQLPNTVQPGRIEKDIKPTPSLPVPSESITVPRSEPQQMPAEAASIKFTLKAITISGNTVFTQEQLSANWSSMLGKEVRLSDIFALAQKLTAQYRDAGYILSQVIVPVQDIQDGQVTLEVIEGFIDNVEIQGASDALKAKLQAYLDKIKAEKPLTGATLERQLLLINDLSGVMANAYLKASNNPNATGLILNFAQSKYSGSLGVHNRVSELIGTTQFDASFSVNNLFGLFEQNSFRALSTNTGDMYFLSYTGNFPIGTSGLTFSPNLGYSKNQPDLSGGAELESSSKSGGFTFAYPLIRSREQNLSVRSGLSLFNSETKIAGLTADRFKLRTLRVGATYDKVDKLGGVNQVDAEFSRGLRGFGAEDDLGANGDNLTFTKTTLYVARLQSLAPRWSVLAAFNGQHTNDILLSPERFGLGGEGFLRGFDSSELLGDSGMAGKLELRYNFAMSNIGFTAYGLAESGKVWTHNFNAPTTTDHASTIGLGLRFSAPYNLNGYIELDKPLGRDVATKGDRDTRLFANLMYNF